MTETRTPRFELPQWSSGSDSPSRADFNEAFSNVETRAGQDDGTSAGTLPTTNLVAGRSFALDAGADGYTIYRYDGSGWRFTGGTLVPVGVRFAARDGQALTGTALSVTHPSRSSAALSATYGGDLAAAGVLRSFDADDDTRGLAVVGWSGTPSAGTHGRLHVRTRRAGDLGVVAQAHAANAGNLFTVREQGGQDIVTVDAAGRLTGRAPSAFGGASVAASASLAVAPTSAAGDGVTAGVLLYGQSSADTKSILRVQRDAVDTAPVLLVGRDMVEAGRLPWGSAYNTAGYLRLSGNRIVLRSSGNADNPAYVQVRRSDPTSPATEADTSKDTLLWQVAAGSIVHSMPTTVNNMAMQNDTASMTVQRFGNFVGNFLDLTRLVPDGGGGQTVQLASQWDSQGRLRSGAWWRSTGYLRDARQPVVHASAKRWAGQGSSTTGGIVINSNGSFTYVWPTMTTRSATVSDLEVFTTAEVMLVNANLDEDAQSINVRTDYSLDGGSTWTAAAYSENAAAATGTKNGFRPAGMNFTSWHVVAGLNPGAEFVLRTVVSAGGALPTARLRCLDLRGQESLVEYYATA